MIEPRGYSDPVQGSIELERCFEFKVPPSSGFLRFLLENPQQLQWPCTSGEPQKFSAKTQQASRESLIGMRDEQAQHATQDAARRALAQDGVVHSARRWWAFEGFTEADCCLQG
jgi:hypothetical protein